MKQNSYSTLAKNSRLDQFNFQKTYGLVIAYLLLQIRSAFSTAAHSTGPLQSPKAYVQPTTIVPTGTANKIANPCKFYLNKLALVIYLSNPVNSFA